MIQLKDPFNYLCLQLEIKKSHILPISFLQIKKIWSIVDRILKGDFWWVNCLNLKYKRYKD